MGFIDPKYYHLVDEGHPVVEIRLRAHHDHESYDGLLTPTSVLKHGLLTQC